MYILPKDHPLVGTIIAKHADVQQYDLNGMDINAWHTDYHVITVQTIEYIKARYPLTGAAWEKEGLELLIYVWYSYPYPYSRAVYGHLRKYVDKQHYHFSYDTGGD